MFIESTEKITNNFWNVVDLIWKIIALPLGVYLNHLWTRRRRKEDLKTEKITALEDKFSESCKEFISCFDDAIYKLTSTGEFPVIIFFKEMPRHKIAYDKFRRILINTRSSKTVSRFDEVWQEYYCEDPNTKYDTGEGKEKDRELAIKNINIVVEFVDNL